MLERLIIRGFQAHKKLDLTFDPGITTIVGSNDVGKSAVLRALKWVCLNDSPDGNFINWDKSEARVKLFVDGSVVIRTKGKSNSYQLDDDPLKSFRLTVPTPVAQKLNVSEINFQDQHDSPFWISLTPGQVSKELNQIINLGVIDDTLSNTLSRLRKANTNVELVEERLDSARKDRKSLKWVLDAQIQLSKIELQQAEIADKRARLEELKSYIDRVREYQLLKRRLADFVTEGQDIASKGSSVVEQVDRVQTLQEMTQQYARLLKIKKLDVPKVKGVEPLLQGVTELERLIGEYEETQQWVTSKSEKLSTLKKTVSGIKTCPLCGHVLSQSSVLTSTCHTSHQ